MIAERHNEVISRLFARLQGIYGTAFTAKFSTGFNERTQQDDGWENAKVVWTEDMAGYLDRLDVIADALKYVDPKFPPTSREFLQLCNNSAKQINLRNQPSALPFRPDPEKAKSAAARLMQQLTGKSEDYDPLLWAKRPKSQKAMDAVIDGAKRNDSLRQILADLKAANICNEAGKPVKRYKGQGQWVTA